MNPDAPHPSPPRIAVVIPCHDEAATIAKVVTDFRRVLPSATIIVVDNGSRDASANLALAAGAELVREPRPGKGFAMLRGFRATDADFVLMVDGDDTYPAEAAPALFEAAIGGADQVVGTRLGGAVEGAFPPGHSFGNRLFIGIVRLLFGVRTGDLFSGYRVLSRRFLRTTPLLATGFEIEAELTLQAAMRGFSVVEMPVAYRPRGADGGVSKLATFRDGSRILFAILTFFRDYRPLTCFGALAALFAAGALIFGSAVIADFISTGWVHRLPLAVLAAALFILSALSLTCGVLLSSINRRAAEIAALVAGR
ncbi:MAG: glycosyltransferase family 2 protein [Thermoanaerobaculia bacterium]